MIVQNVQCLNVDKLYEAARFVSTYRYKVKHQNYTGSHMQKFFNIAQISLQLIDVNFIEAYALKILATKFLPTEIYLHSTLGKFSESSVTDSAIHLEKLSEVIFQDIKFTKAYTLNAINNDKYGDYSSDNRRIVNEYIASLPAAFACMKCNVSFSGSELLRILSDIDNDDELIPTFDSAFSNMYNYELKPLSEFTTDELDDLYAKTCSVFSRKLFHVIYSDVIPKLFKASDDELSLALINGDCKRELPETAPALISYIKSEYGAVDFIDDPKETILSNLKDIKKSSGTPLEYTFSLKTTFFTFIALATALPRGKVVILDEIANLNADIYKDSEWIPKAFDQLTKTLADTNKDNPYMNKVKELIVNYRTRLGERYDNFYDGLHTLAEKGDLSDSMMLHMCIPNQTQVHYMITVTESDIRDYIHSEVFHSSEYTRVYNLIVSQISKLR